MTAADLTNREKWVIREATNAALEKAVGVIQEMLAAADNDAASNGNIWWQGRISGLQSAESAIADLVPEQVPA